MVVCRCRKATKVYCFVHKAPVCADCICFPEHRLCVVRTYSDWVIDGDDYDWPPKCAACQIVIEDEDTSTTRLGCLHNLHSSCLQSHLENFPPHTAPAGYGCPTCSTAVWPPNKYFKESGSALYSSIKEVVTQVSAAKVLLGADSAVQSREAPPAFASVPLAEMSGSAVGVVDGEGVGSAAAVDADSSNGEGVCAMEYHGNEEGPLATGSGMAEETATTSKTAAGSSLGSTQMNIIPPDSRFSKPALTTPQAGTTTRKHAMRVDRSHVEQDDSDDEDGNSRKYLRRGPSYRQILKYVPFVSSGLPTLPVSRQDGYDGEEVIDDRRRRRYRPSSMELILLFAIMSCMATAVLLYYRLAGESGFSEDGEVDDQ